MKPKIIVGSLIALVLLIAAIAGGSYLIYRRAEAAAAPPPPDEAIDILGAPDSKVGAAECSIQPIGPLLKKTDYEKYEMTREDDGATVHETIGLPGNVTLNLRTSGCEDFETVQFEFTVPRAAVPATPAERLAWLRDEVGSLLLMDGKVYVTRLEILVKKFGTLNVMSEDRFKKIEICNNTDAEPPSCADAEDSACRRDCDWEAGGASQFLWDDDGSDTMTLSFVYVSAA